MAPAISKTNQEQSNLGRPSSKQVDLDYTKVKSLILEALAIIRSDNFERYFDLFTEDAVWMM
ncbi:MAG: hypothetical protein ACI9FB_001247, partial [Candidatus Azotimanducaceae bacterium]